MARQQTYTIEEEYDRLQADKESLVEEAVELEAEMQGFDSVPDDLTNEYQQTLAEGHQTDRHLTGLAWARDPPEGDPIDSIALSALTAGDEQWVTGRTEAMADQLAATWGADAEDVDGGRVLHVAAVGIETCPRFDGSPGPEARVEQLRGWHPSFVRWIADRVDDLSTPEVEGKNFGALLQAKRSDDEPDASGDGSS